MTKLTDLELPYPEDSEAPDGPTQIGNLAKKVDDLLQIAGGSGGHFFSKTELKREGTAWGSFGTPIRVSGLRCDAGQMLEITCFGVVKLPGPTIVNTGLRIAVNGEATGFEANALAKWKESGGRVFFTYADEERATSGAGVWSSSEYGATTPGEVPYGNVGAGRMPVIMPKALSSFTVELQGRADASLPYVATLWSYLNCRVVG